MLLAAPLRAQVESRAERAPQTVSDTLDATQPLATADTFQPIALPLTTFDLAAPAFCGMSPWTNDYGFDWRLHDGFNAQLSMSLTVGGGQKNLKGIGFGQSAAFAYVRPLSSRFDVAIGVYADNMTWGGYRATDGGVAATLRYRASDVVSLYAYAAKSFLPNSKRRFLGFFPYGYPVPTERVGAMAEFKVGQNASIQISVEKRDY